jgi:cytochrome c oxidase subunit 4
MAEHPTGGNEERTPHASPGAGGHGGHGGHGAADGDPAAAHILPMKLLVGVFLGLVVMTWVTVAATHVNLGAGNLWLAMAIATVKALLVALFFMHLRWDRPINSVIFIGALLFVFLFVGMLLTDTSSYRPEMIPGYAPAMPPR